jgi:hypothetical protein
MQKTAATMSETVGLGAGSGAAAGALAALLADDPDLGKVLKNALIGGAGGAVIGAGTKALRSPGGPSTAPTLPTSKEPEGMNLALAALTGMLPGIAPAIHGGVSEGLGQGLASGGASLAGSSAVIIPALLKAQGAPIPKTSMVRPAALLASILGATGAAYAGNRLRAKEAAEKSAVLGFKALVGNTAPIKAMLRQLRADGVKINRVRPAASGAQLPGTGHLPVGVSNYRMDKILPEGVRRTSEVPYNDFAINVGKGRARMIPEIQMRPDGQMAARWQQGVAGGTNYSPLSSFMHEGGHHLHQKAMRAAAARDPARFGVAPGDINRYGGQHTIPGQPQLSTVLNELGANNAALQVMQGAGASDDAMRFYKHMRRPSFLSHANQTPQTPLSSSILAQGQHGFTPGYTGLADLYAPAVKSAAEIVRKTKMVEENHDHCPHCDHEFTEKGYPRPTNLPDDQEERDKVLRSGDYDEVCPACGGIVDQRELTDEEIESSLSFFSGDKAGAEEARKNLRARREKQRRRKADREKSASAMAPKDLRYWDDVNEAVRKKVAALEPAEQAKAAVGQVDVVGSCGHGIRKGNNGVKVEIGKKCLVCVKAGDMGKSASLRASVLGGMVKAASWGSLGRFVLRGALSPTGQRVMRSKPFQAAERAVFQGAGNVASHVLQHPGVYGPLSRNAGKLAVAGGVGVGAAASSPLWAPQVFGNPQAALPAQPAPQPAVLPQQIPPTGGGTTAARG